MHFVAQHQIQSGPRRQTASELHLRAWWPNLGILLAFRIPKGCQLKQMWIYVAAITNHFRWETTKQVGCWYYRVASSPINTRPAPAFRKVRFDRSLRDSIARCSLPIVVRRDLSTQAISAPAAVERRTWGLRNAYKACERRADAGRPLRQW